MSSNATLLHNNSLIARVVGTLDTPGRVLVEYWNEDVGRFRSRAVGSDGTNFAVHVVRLRVRTEYTYRVIGVARDGRESAGRTGTFTTGELPGALAAAEFNVVTGSPTHELTFMEFLQPGFWGLVAIDGEGHIVWYYSSRKGSGQNHTVGAMARKSNGNIVHHATEMPERSNGLVEINPLGEEVDRLESDCPTTGPIHHEAHLLADGRVMYLSKTILRPGFGELPVPQVGDIIGIWDQKTRENKIVWNIFDHLSPGDRTDPSSDETRPEEVDLGGCVFDEAVQDWSHGNSTYMAEDGSVVVSFRHLNQVVSIAPDFQSVQWRLGGPGSDFIFPDADDRFYHQHTAVPLPNGNVLLFDNGNFRPEEEGSQYSRALELELDFDSMTATKIWEYRHKPSTFAVCCSVTHRLENGNTYSISGSQRRKPAVGPSTSSRRTLTARLCGKSSTILPASPPSIASTPAMTSGERQGYRTSRPPVSTR